MSQIAIIVEFETKAGHFKEFESLITAHAQKCLQLESGCLRFEVIYPIDDEGQIIQNKIVVNELYKDMAAVQLHRGTERMVALRPDFDRLLQSRHLILAQLPGDAN